MTQPGKQASAMTVIHAFMKHIVSLIIMFASPCAFAGEAALSFSVSPSTITIGDPVRVSFSVATPAGTSVVPPEKTAEIGPWTVRDIAAAPDTRTPGATGIVYTLTTFTTGQVVIPPLAVAFAGASSGTVATPPFTVRVDSVLEKFGMAGDIRDIKPPVTVRRPLSFYVTGALVVLAILGGAYWWYRRYQRRQRAAFPAPAVPAVPPYQLAMERLAALRASSLVADGKIKEFYIQLSDIIRDYIAGVYEIETRDKTTAEIYAQLRRAPVDAKMLASIRDFFDACDLVKFARYRPDETGARQDCDAAEAIITFKG